MAEAEDLPFSMILEERDSFLVKNYAHLNEKARGVFQEPRSELAPCILFFATGHTCTPE